jgi:hypothetical protein
LGGQQTIFTGFTTFGDRQQAPEARKARGQQTCGPPGGSPNTVAQRVVSNWQQKPAPMPCEHTGWLHTCARHWLPEQAEARQQPLPHGTWPCGHCALTHWPLTQVWLFAQTLHMAPFVPHAVGDVPGKQTLF